MWGHFGFILRAWKFRSRVYFIFVGGRGTLNLTEFSVRFLLFTLSAECLRVLILIRFGLCVM